jgi:hypothetical protein
MERVVKYESEAEEWKAKARRAEEQAAKAANKRTADTWSEIARIYWELAARSEAWEKVWKPRPRGTAKDSGQKDKPN